MSVLEIRKTEQKGRGVYSLEHFESNQVILKFNGTPLNKEMVYGMPDAISENFLQIGKNKYLDLNGETSLFINHSCNPNTTVKIMASSAFLIANRHILPNEELCFDYSLTSTEPAIDWSMNCDCNEWNCRKVVSGFNSLSEKDKERYSKFIPNYIKN